MMFLPISVPGKVAASTKSSFEVRAYIIASQINLTKMSAFFSGTASSRHWRHALTELKNLPMLVIFFLILSNNDSLFNLQCVPLDITVLFYLVLLWSYCFW